MTTDTIIVPEEDRLVVVVAEERVIVVPPERRKLEVTKAMLMGSKQHTAGDTRKWIVSYERWLDNTVDIDSVDVTSSSASCTVQSSVVSGDDVVFYLTGGNLGEHLTVTLKVTDTDGNVNTNTLAFTVVAP